MIPIADPRRPTPADPVLILGIDTSGRQGSVALLRAARRATRSLVELAPSPAANTPSCCVPTIAALLARHGLERSSIGLIAVASGPGSFTGLRVAIATVKGLAEAFATPVVAVSVLEAIALASGAGGKVVAAIDAQRSEVFWGEYERRIRTARRLAQGCNVLSESIASFADFASHVRLRTSAADLHPRRSARRSPPTRLESSPPCSPGPRPKTFARIAYRKFLAGERADVATLDANYLRRSDAELFSTPKPSIVQRRK